MGEAIGKEWNLAVSSIREAIHAIDILTKKKLTRYLLQKEKGQAQYKFLINNKPVKHHPNFINEQNIHAIKDTELVVNFTQLNSIDIVPVIEGSDLNKILGAVLIVIGIVLIIVGAIPPTNILFISAGVFLVAAGIAMFLNKPPKMQPFRNIDEGGLTSYFFGGALNITNEGGPVPIGYGEAIVGSQVISVGFVIGLRYYQPGAISIGNRGGGNLGYQYQNYRYHLP